MLIFGEMYGNEPTPFYNGKGAMDVSVSAYICMVTAVTGIMSLPLTVSQYRERKILKRFRATPITEGNILFSQVIANIILTLVGISLLLLLGVIKYDVKLYGNPVIVFGTGLLVALAMFSVGLLIAGVSKNGKSATAIANLIYFPMLFLSGATFPYEMLPDGIKTFSNILPLTHGVKLMRGAWFGEPILDYSLEIAILFFATAICTFFSIKFFKWE
jgi:ABC-2 type transport system permease protein